MLNIIKTPTFTALQGPGHSLHIHRLGALFLFSNDWGGARQPGHTLSTLQPWLPNRRDQATTYTFMGSALSFHYPLTGEGPGSPATP